MPWDKGSDTINTISNTRSDDIKTVSGQTLHNDCLRGIYV